MKTVWGLPKLDIKKKNPMVERVLKSCATAGEENAW